MKIEYLALLSLHGQERMPNNRVLENKAKEFQGRITSIESVPYKTSNGKTPNMHRNGILITAQFTDESKVDEFEAYLARRGCVIVGGNVEAK